ncbi:MAG: Cocaine esterase, partial [uncultured Truepera sp.]
MPARLAVMPTSDHPVLATSAPWFSEWLRHPGRDQFWQDLSVDERADRVTVPAFHVGGWFDIFAGSTTRAFTRMRSAAGSAEARDGQRLIIGPWDHLTYSGLYRDRQFGMSADVAAIDLTGAHIAFYDRWLRGREGALDGSAPVRIFVMGIDQWRDEQDWPLPDTRYSDYFLGGAGRANTADGDGTLTPGTPGPDGSDTFTYDPGDPVPSLGGRLLMPSALNAVGPVDQAPVERRDDVLCFTTPVLAAAVEVTGNVSLELYVSSSAVDSDFTGKLVDVFPDGRAIYLTDGILRTRHRNALDRPEMMRPGQVYQITLDLSVTSNVFLPGHRIRLEVSSSNFPRYDRNTNTGGVIAEEGL